MTYAKRSEQFPAAMQEILEEVFVGGEYKQECSSWKEALGERARFYSYFSALRRESHLALGHSTEEKRSLTAMANKIEICVQGTTLLLRDRDNSPSARRMKENLEKAREGRTSSSSPAAETSLQRLEEILRKGEGK